MITTFSFKNGVLVSANDQAYNPEIEAALVADGSPTYVEKFRNKCAWIYDRVQKWYILTDKQTDEIDDYIASVSGRILTINTDFEQVMKDEGLQDLLGKVRIIRIEFETKTVTNGKNCEPCEC